MPYILSGLTRILYDAYAGNLACQGVGNICSGHFDQLLSCHLADCGDGAFLFLHAVSHHHHFVEHFGVFGQSNRHVGRSSGYFPGDVSEEGYLQHGAFCYAEREFAVYIGYCAVPCAFFRYVGADNNFAVGVNYYTGNSHLPE